MKIYIYIYIFICLFVVILLHTNLLGLFNAKSTFLEREYWYYLIYSWEERWVHTFCKSICLKVNVIARLEFELAYYNITMGTPPTIYIYIFYIYVYLGSISSLMQISLNIIDILCLHIFFWIRSNSRITFIVFGGNWFRYCP